MRRRCGRIVDDHVFETFNSARSSSARRTDWCSTIAWSTIEQALITGSRAADRDVAVVTVRFEADIAAVTRNAEGEVVAGSLSDAVQTRDLWTFRRDIGSRDPNWLLIETDEEE